MRRIKLIWDLRGPSALQTALHHEKHLKEFAGIENLSGTLTGHSAINDVHAIAFLVVDEADMIQVRDALKPHRGEVYDA